MFKRIWILLILIGIIFATAGCSVFDNYISHRSEKKIGVQEKKQDSGKVLTIDPDPQPEEKLVTLYFKHKYYDYLVPETRMAVHEKQTYEQLVVEQLLKGTGTHDRVSIIPPDVRVLDVTRKGETVFVNLSEEFNGPIDLSTIPGKVDVPEEKKPAIQAEMKRLAIYSIVNSLTELDGVNEIKILVNNKAIGYQEMGEELAKLMFKGLADKGQNGSSAMLTALYREKSFILTPAKSVQLVFEGLTGEPKWDQVYSLLASQTMTQGELPSKEALQKLWPALISGLELDSNFIREEEIKPDGKAFVTISYTVNFTSGTKEKKEKDLVTVVSEEGIWKVKMPEFLNNVR